MNDFTVIVLLVVAIGIFILTFITYYSDTQRRQQEFELKLKAASTAKNTHILNMPYKELLSVIDTNMMYYVDQEIMVSGILLKGSDEERSLQFNTILIDTCARVDTSLSDSIKEALYFYISPEHLQIYIKDSCRVLLIAKIEQRLMNVKNNQV